jgi:sulfur-carrier protein
VKIKVQVPGVLRPSCGGAAVFELSAASLRDACEQIEELYPELNRSIRDETGAVRRHINLFVNTANSRDLRGLETELAAGDVVTILPAVSGG